jgi:hypothetical protein
MGTKKATNSPSHTVSWVKGKTTWLCQLGLKLARIPRVTDKGFSPKV